MSMYTPKYFTDYELFSKETMLKYKDQFTRSQLLTEELKITLDQIHDFFSDHFKDIGKIAMVVNNWSVGGKYSYRCYRPAGCGVGAEKGEHYKGNAADFDLYVAGDRINPDRVRCIIVANQSKFPHLKRMEDGVNWVHIDCKDMSKTGVYLFKV